ncbi:hypothetical protein BV22DRAFT_215652 [Leucogyrophana mollusca]|uniref:Uncharacterized protein n=1 Tax=Leucogyrophana mollusca TaxID=85980 RepID=A0ACB8BS74_9AGAM|nr:hypothetical protein BV22DRAFT_215652 [Leucogyrophana mollusca]
MAAVRITMHMILCMAWHLSMWVVQSMRLNSAFITVAIATIGVSATNYSVAIYKSEIAEPQLCEGNLPSGATACTSCCHFYSDIQNHLHTVSFDTGTSKKKWALRFYQSSGCQGVLKPEYHGSTNGWKEVPSSLHKARSLRVCVPSY